MNTSQLVTLDLDFPDVALRFAVAAYLARFKGSVPGAHRVRPARATWPGAATTAWTRCTRAAAAHRALHAVDAGGPPVQALHRVPAGLGRGRLLPHLRHRRRPRALPGRARPPTRRARRVTHPRADPPAVRSAAHRRPRLDQRQRLRAGRHARPARAADLRSHRRRHRPTSARNTATASCACAARATRSS